MAKSPKSAVDKDAPRIIDIAYPRQDEIVVHLLGTRPLYHHCMSMDAMIELLIPSPRKNAAAKAANMKHEPLREYRESAYVAIGDHHPTRLLMRADALKRSLGTAALETAGVFKSEIGRDVYVQPDSGIFLYVWGKPVMSIESVRMSDMKRTPDMRTRAVCVEWCARARIKYLADRFTATAIVNLVARAGIVSGWGDARQEKGARSEGLWEVVNAEDENWQRIAKTQGRAVQDTALEQPEFLDHVSEALYNAWCEEVERRGRREKAGSIDVRSARPNGGAPEVDAAVVASVSGRGGKRRTPAQQST
jgi:hypothetical protein